MARYSGTRFWSAERRYTVTYRDRWSYRNRWSVAECPSVTSPRDAVHRAFPNAAKVEQVGERLVGRLCVRTSFLVTMQTDGSIPMPCEVLTW
jgi:hypothetical protein